MKITLAAGRAHLKHTEGGDFRQATYRAVRQGLKKAECILLEPVYEFRLELPNDLIGRGMTDIQKMHGTFQPPETEGEVSVLTGSVPAADHARLSEGSDRLQPRPRTAGLFPERIRAMPQHGRSHGSHRL